MHDFNFFVIYSKDYQKRFDRNSPFLKAALVVLIFILLATGLTAKNALVAARNDMKIMEIETLKDAPGYIEALELHRVQKAMAAYDEKASIALDKLEKAKVLGSDLLIDLTRKIPSNISISSLNIGIDSMNIACTGPDRKAIAEFQLRLKELAFVGEVHVEDVRNNTDAKGVDTVIVCTLVREDVGE